MLENLTNVLKVMISIDICNVRMKLLLIILAVSHGTLSVDSNVWVRIGSKIVHNYREFSSDEDTGYHNYESCVGLVLLILFLPFPSDVVASWDNHYHLGIVDLLQSSISFFLQILPRGLRISRGIVLL